MKEYGKLLQEIADKSEEYPGIHDTLKDDEQAARTAAGAITRYNRAIETCEKSLDDWSDTLKSVNKGSKKWLDTVADMSDSVEDLLDLDPGALDKYAESLDWDKIGEGLKKAISDDEKIAAEGYADVMDAV